jgi:hypothetical protein
MGALMDKIKELFNRNDKDKLKEWLYLNEKEGEIRNIISNFLLNVGVIVPYGSGKNVFLFNISPFVPILSPSLSFSLSEEESVQDLHLRLGVYSKKPKDEKEYSCAFGFYDIGKDYLRIEFYPYPGHNKKIAHYNQELAKRLLHLGLYAKYLKKGSFNFIPTKKLEVEMFNLKKAVFDKDKFSRSYVKNERMLEKAVNKLSLGSYLLY